MITRDDRGEDLIIITAPDAAGGMGHTSLLIQDKEGIWYYYYFGCDPDVGLGVLLPIKHNAEIVYQELKGCNITSRIDSSFYHSINTQISHLHDQSLKTPPDWTYERAIYWEGDFTAAHNAALGELHNAENEYYVLYWHNCVIRSIHKIEATVPDIQLRLNDLMHKSNASTYPGAISMSVSGIIPNIVHMFLQVIVDNSK